MGVRFVVVAGCRSGAFRSEGSSWHDVRRTSLSGSLVQAGRPRADRRREAAPGIMCRMITVCDTSALARWADSRLPSRLGSPLESPSPQEWSLASAREFAAVDLHAAQIEATEKRPLHILVRSPQERVRSKRLRCHVWSRPLPDGALYQLTDDVLLVSPQLCLQQMAPRSSIARIASAATELSGWYGRSPNAPNGFYKRAPVIVPDTLLNEITDVTGYGVQRLRAALSYVVQGSRSPMETVVMLLFTLPTELGGCGMPQPQLNCRIEIPPALQRALGKSYLVVDMVWPEWMIVLEYDSYAFHSQPVQVDGDHTRNEGLRDLGWMVRSVTAGMLTNDAILRELTTKVATRAGITLPSDEAYLRRRHNLVRELLRGP